MFCEVVSLVFFDMHFLKLLRKLSQNPRPVPRPENPGLTMNAKRRLNHVKRLKSLLDEHSRDRTSFRIYRAKARRTIKRKKRASWK